MKKVNFFYLLVLAAFITLVNEQTLMAQTNTATGFGALTANTTGINNTAMGYQTLNMNTTGSGNSAHGSFALYGNTTGSDNTAMGHNAILRNRAGFNNTAFGKSALEGGELSGAGSNSNNTAIGVSALSNNTGGRNNTATGAFALRLNGFGNRNTATGDSALYTNFGGSLNTATGSLALFRNFTGANNTATGGEALFSNTTGDINTATGYTALRANTSGVANTASGVAALQANTIGIGNTSAGFNSLFSNTIGNRNTAGGGAALAQNTTGSDNAAFGIGAGFSTNSFSSTFIGSFADAAASVTNSTALGSGAYVNASNQVRIGNSAVTSIGGFSNWTNLSDGRFKKNVNEDVPGLSFITKLRAVTYTLDVDGINSKLKANMPQIKGEAAILMADKKPSAEEQKAKAEKGKVKYTGFVAQEVEEAAKKLNYDFSGVDAPKEKDGFYGLRYAEFVVPLVKAVQELSEENKRLKEDMQQKINRLEELVIKLSNGQNVNRNNSNNAIVNLSSAYLEQNIPNPHQGNTVIRYHFPQGTTNAKIVVYNMKGQLVKSIDLHSNGDGQLTLNAGTLTAGTYTYSLWIDGKEADAKKMVLAR